MNLGSLTSSTAVVAFALSGSLAGQAPQSPAIATFQSSVDLVRISAVVRDHRGRFVQHLSARDFEILDAGEPRRIADFRHDLAGVSIALLFDVSGSMEARLTDAREAAGHVLSWMDPRDEAAVFTFDTELQAIAPFTEGLRTLPGTMAEVTPFGATSLHDAVAQTAKRVGSREGRRRAVVVLTDGNDNASHLEPAEVSSIASAIDVPVYILGIVASIDNPTSDERTSTSEHSPLSGPLADLASRTGGHVFIASTPAQRSLAARQIIDELRHQYLLAFEASGNPGWHPLVIRARDKDLTVRARSGYVAGRQPNSE
jgi:VWFA-related protein